MTPSVVILSAAKHPEACTTSTVSETLRFFTSFRMTIRDNVMLSNAKHLLAGYALCAQPLVGFEEILRYTQNDTSFRYA